MFPSARAGEDPPSSRLWILPGSAYSSLSPFKLFRELAKARSLPRAPVFYLWHAGGNGKLSAAFIKPLALLEEWSRQSEARKHTHTWCEMTKQLFLNHCWVLLPSSYKWMENKNSLCGFLMPQPQLEIWLLISLHKSVRHMVVSKE